MAHPDAASIEQQVRACVAAALRGTLAIPRDKAWVVDFVAESITVELQAEQQPTNSNRRGSDDDVSDPKQKKASEAQLSSKAGSSRQDASRGESAAEPSGVMDLNPLALLAGLPETVEECEDQFGPLLYENLDEVDPDDVRSFCSRLVHDLQLLRDELINNYGGSASDGEGIEGACELCGREMPLTKHHLIPRDVHKEWKKKGFSADELQVGAMLCRPCHSAVHRAADNKTLAQKYNTVEALMEVESIQRHAAWARKQKVVANSQNLPAKFRHKR